MLNAVKISDLDLSVVIPAKDEGPNLDLLLPQLRSALAELGVRSPLVDQLAGAVRNGDWVTVRTIAEHLSIDVTSAR